MKTPVEMTSLECPNGRHNFTVEHPTHNLPRHANIDFKMPFQVSLAAPVCLHSAPKGLHTVPISVAAP